MQFDKRHATTILSAVALAANRFISYDGNYATAAGGGKDCQGISEHAVDAAGQPLSAITHYSGLVEASAAIAVGDYVKPAVDGTGRAAVGTLADHCGRALSAASGAGELVEVERVRHIHA